MPHTKRVDEGGGLYHALNRGNNRVNEALTTKELDRLRECVPRGRPYGDAMWTEKIADRLDLWSTIRPRGRLKEKTMTPVPFVRLNWTRFRFFPAATGGGNDAPGTNRFYAIRNAQGGK